MRNANYITRAQVKELAALRVKKFRRKAGLFLVEGAVVIREALESGWEIEKVLVNAQKIEDEGMTEFIAALEAASVQTMPSHGRDMKKLSDTVSPADAVAVVRSQSRCLDDLKRDGGLRLAVAGGVQDPGNTGAIIRSADAFGLDGLILGKGCAQWQNGKVIRGAAGSCFHLPIVSEADIVETMEWLKSNGARIFAAVSRGGKDVGEVSVPERWAVVLGNETTGPPREALERCDERISIRMPGGAESLNVAVSAGIIFYLLGLPVRDK